MSSGSGNTVGKKWKFCAKFNVESVSYSDQKDTGWDSRMSSDIADCFMCT